MALTTRTISNTGDPLLLPNGLPLANKMISFLLVDTTGKICDTFDAISGERVSGKIDVITDINGEFSVALWPNDRGATVTKYLCHTEVSGIADFVASVPSGASVLTWFALMSNSVALPAVGANYTYLNSGLFPAKLPNRKSLKAIFIGNSIAAQCQHGAINWSIKSDIHQADSLVKNLFAWQRPTATARMDGWGVYGYSGQTSPTILLDLPAQVFAPLASAGILPDLVSGHSLVENDIAQAYSFSAIKSTVNQFITDIHARYPSAIIHLCTPRPSFGYDTAAKVLVFQQVRDWMLSLDNGTYIYVTNTSSPYENPLSLGTPLGTSASPIYTDASVHPNGKGALILGRAISDTFRRIAGSWMLDSYSLSSNMAMAGATGSFGAGVTGTAPNGVYVNAPVNGSIVSLAENSGFLQTITANASGGSEPLSLGSSTIGWQAVILSANAQVSPFVEVEVVSGAENIGFIELLPQWTGTTGSNATQNYQFRNTAEGFVDYANGDNFLIRMPPMKASDLSGITGVITNINPYLIIVPKNTGGAYSVRVKSWGIGVVVP